MLRDFLGGYSYRARQFLIGLPPRLRISRIDKRERLAAIQPLCDFVNCNSCCFHNMNVMALREDIRITNRTNLFDSPVITGSPRKCLLPFS
jgi:hypothetical protein